jgi:hypothetical protein
LQSIISAKDNIITEDSVTVVFAKAKNLRLCRQLGCGPVIANLPSVTSVVGGQNTPTNKYQYFISTGI